MAISVASELYVLEIDGCSSWPVCGATHVEVAVGLSYLTTYRVVKPLFATDVSAVLS